MSDFYDLFNNPFKILFLSFFILLSFMWLFLPFAIYGLRDKLDRILGLLENISLEIQERRKKDSTVENHEFSSISKENRSEDSE
mgnify:CR=1 FL=1|tara:strand:- start:142 stop:393 length:252 start_codon:yes stop_codon:yes gene_type:complete